MNNTYIVMCFGQELNNKTKARLFGKKLEATSGAEAILRYRQYLKKQTIKGYAEYGERFEGIFKLGHMIFEDFEARMI